jgi:WD40 repeat protein
VNASKPDFCVDADSYVMSVAFHPEEPSLLAGGAYNGEIIVWNTASDSSDNVVCQTESNLTSETIQHSDPVHQVRWVANKRDSKPRYVIVSISGDGKILIWTMNNDLSQCIAGYEVRNKRGGVEGITCFGILHHLSATLSNKIEPTSLDSTVLLGTEAGRIYRTNIKPVTLVEGVAAKTANVKVTLGDPVVFKYEAHQGPIHSLECSPFHRNLFLTCSSDGSVKLFNVYETGRLHVVIPSNSINSYIYCADWSPVRPFVFACASRDSNLYIFDLEESNIRPCVVIPISTDAQPVLSCKFNYANREFLATGDEKGQLKVWRLSDKLCTRSSHESTLLSNRAPEIINELWLKYSGLVF